MASRIEIQPHRKYDHGAATPAYSYPSTPGTFESGHASNNANARGRKTASHYIHKGISYDPSNAKEDYLQMAKDDVPDNKVSCASSTAEIFSVHSAVRTVLGGPFLPRPHWCVQNHTLVSAFFSPEAPTPSHRRFPNEASKKHVPLAGCCSTFGLLVWYPCFRFLRRLFSSIEGSLLQTSPVVGEPSCVGTARTPESRLRTFL